MRWKLSVFIALTLCLLFFNAATAGERQPELVRLSDPTPMPYPDAGNLAQLHDCAPGNHDPAAVVLREYVEIGDECAMVFYPQDACDKCTMGFQVDTIHFVAEFWAPCSFDFEVSLAVVDPPSGVDCHVVRHPVCTSQSFTVTASTPGVYDVAVPISCACALVPGSPYAIIVKPLGWQCPVVHPVGLMFDASYQSCINFQKVGNFWLDMNIVLPDIPGDLLFYAEANCRQLPVGADKHSWGALKSPYEHRH